MSDWLARFRELTADDPRFRSGDNSDNRDNSSAVECDRAINTRDPSAIVAIVPFVTTMDIAGARSHEPNVKVEPDTARVDLNQVDNGDNRWCDLFTERTAIRQYDGGYTYAAAEQLAWGELETRWHMQHGERISRDICAGCRRPIGNSAAIDLIDRNRVHCSGDSDCLRKYGRRWRDAARRALIAFGIRPPTSFDTDPKEAFPGPFPA